MLETAAGFPTDGEASTLRASLVEQLAAALPAAEPAPEPAAAAQPAS